MKKRGSEALNSVKTGIKKPKISLLKGKKWRLIGQNCPLIGNSRMSGMGSVILIGGRGGRESARARYGETQKDT